MPTRALDELRPALIDDVHAALSRLTPFGEAVVAPSALRVRDAVMSHVRARDWLVVNHRGFAGWIAHARVRSCVVLDPFLDCVRELDQNRWRLSRLFTPDGWRIYAEIPPSLALKVRGKTVCLVDDVASSGRTLCHVIEKVLGAGGHVSAIYASVAAERAREAVSRSFPAVTWVLMVNEPRAGIQLRDGCVGLPYAGRPVFSLSPIKTGVGLIERRACPTTFRGGFWDKVGNDPAVRASIEAARHELVDEFTRQLRRPPRLADLHLLGPDVAAVVSADRPVGPETPLREVLQ